MEILTEYVYDHDGEDFICIPLYRTLPHKKARTTGNYKTINGKIYVEIEEKHFFGLSIIQRWIDENDFRFTEIEYFNCEVS